MLKAPVRPEKRPPPWAAAQPSRGTRTSRHFILGEVKELVMMELVVMEVMVVVLLVVVVLCCILYLAKGLVCDIILS